MVRPMQCSPKPLSAQDGHLLQLVPAKALTDRFVWALEFLDRNLGPARGAYLEFGVYNGASMLCFLEALRLRGDETMRIFGFDSFRGLPPSAGSDDGGVWHAGQFSCPRTFTEARIGEANRFARQVTLVEGWFADTLPAGDQYGIGAASLVMVDSDTYSSCREALRFIAPLLTDPAIVMFDDWKLNDLDVKSMGEYRAFHEWIGLYPEIDWRPVRSYNRKSQTIVLRRKPLS
jgi:O-methyltransferase